MCCSIHPCHWDSELPLLSQMTYYSMTWACLLVQYNQLCLTYFNPKSMLFIRSIYFLVCFFFVCCRTNFAKNLHSWTQHTCPASIYQLTPYELWQTVPRLRKVKRNNNSSTLTKIMKNIKTNEWKAYAKCYNRTVAIVCMLIKN